MAQEARSDEVMMITEVVVTAQKREEKLQDVPVAVSVVGETELQRRNIGNIDQLKLVVPSFEIHLVRRLGARRGHLDLLDLDRAHGLDRAGRRRAGPTGNGAGQLLRRGPG